jgi:hypothetical protein
VCLRQLAEPLQKLVGRDDVTAFALNGLDDDGRDLVWRDEVHERISELALENGDTLSTPLLPGVGPPLAKIFGG